MTKILDGRAVAQSLETELKNKLQNKNISITLGIIQVGENPSSVAYIKHKTKMANRLGITVAHHKLPNDVSPEELLEHIAHWNADKDITGFILQLPLPDHLDRETIIDSINPKKDVDGITVVNHGRLLANVKGVVPATTRGILSLLDYYDINLSGKQVVVFGRSNLVGLPTAIACIHRNATVSIVHSKTINPSTISRTADVVIVATGFPQSITKQYLNQDSIVIDVGISRIKSSLIGDVDYNSAFGHVAAITPVPGGVGPLTVISLFQNLFDIAIDQA